MTGPIIIDAPTGELKIRQGQKMSLFTTFRIGGQADYLVRVTNREEIALALAWARERELPVTAIGGGSNLLVGDNGVRGLVMLVRATGKDAEAALEIDDLGDEVQIRVPAQMPISRLGHVAAERGWSGLEWCAGLPGNVGGAIVNNAGAHGGEMTDHLVEVELIDLDAGVVTWTADRLNARYRYTVLKHAPRPRRHLVLNGVYRLSKGEPDQLTVRADEYSKWRKQAQPTGACAGSVFTNPEGTYAGYLIDQAGLKGMSVGGVQVSELHGNFLVNTGDATAADVREIISRIQNEVERQFSIRMVPEIEQIGEA